LLAYLFWHRPRPGVDVAEYEEAQRGFHVRLEVESACFRVDQLPFDDGPGYEDWYLIEDWAALGALNVTAVDPVHRPDHDRAAAMAAEGWGGIYASVQGPASIPAQARWLHKPGGQSTLDFLAGIEAGASIWQRQLVLGPAPEFCVASEEDAPREDRRARL
jgi:hypothetical protein